MRDLGILEQKLAEIEEAEEELILYGVAYIAGEQIDSKKPEDIEKLKKLKELYTKRIEDITSKEITEEDCNRYIRLYLEAEEAVLKGQEYTIDGDVMKRADLDKIRKGRIWWENRKSQIKNGTPDGIFCFQICPHEM